MHIDTHHEQAIQRLIALLEDDPRFLALIIEGSVAHGNARPSSDIDVLLIASDEEYARRERDQDFAYFNDTVCDYPSGYIDGKILSLQFLKDAAQRGSEPTRSAFVGAFPAYSHIPDLPALLKNIPVYPEYERAEKMIAFYSQVLIQGGYFLREAIKKNDSYLLTHTVADLVLFGGRLLLAYNRILFSNHKTFLNTLRHASEKPEQVVELAEQLLREPSLEHGRAFSDCISSFQDWGITYTQALNRFFQDSEWNWRAGRPPLADW